MVDHIALIFQTCPSLSTIKLTNDCGPPKELNDPLMISNESLITLTSASELFVGGAPIAFPLLRRLVLPQLEKLCLWEVPHEIALRLASSSTQLKSATLRDLEQSPPPSTVYSLPALTSIFIYTSSNILDHMVLPQLCALTLYDDGYSHLMRSLRHMVEHSTPPILSLDLEGLNLDNEDLFWCFERLPTLESLRLSDCSISDAVLLALATPSLERDHPWLLPRLTKINLYDNDNLTPGGVIKFLASRSGLPSTNAAAPMPLRVEEGHVRLMTYESPDQRKKIESYGITLEACYDSDSSW